MDNAKITRAALGSTASLGDLYDARRDDFCGISIFKSAMPTTAVTTHDANFSDIRLVHSDNFSEKAAKLDVSAELQVSVLAGLLPLKGSARYLSDQKQSAKTVKSSLVYNIKTKDEYLNIYHDDLREHFSIDAIESGLATHVVVGISWGCNSILSCFYENKENRDVREITGNLAAKLKKVAKKAMSISGKGDVEVKEDSNSKGVTFEIHVFGDVLSENQLPTTFETALAFMTQVPSLVKTCNDGKGKPLTYHLLPISLLQKYLKFSLGSVVLVKTLEEASLARVVQMFEQMSAVQQELHDFFEDVFHHKYCVKPGDLEAITALRNDMTIKEKVARDKLSRLLQEVRSGKGDIALLEKFQADTWSMETVARRLAEWDEVKDKVQFAQTLKQLDAKYIGNGTTLEDEILSAGDATSYVLYFTQTAKQEETTRWNDNRQIFFQEMKNQTVGRQYFAVDCDIHPELKTERHLSCVKIMQSGMVRVEDVLAERHRSRNTPLVQFVAESTVRVLYRPNKRVPLAVPCAGQTCNSQVEYKWSCAKCMTGVEYGFDHHIYCICGKTPVFSTEFKCTDPKHGLTFTQHPADFLSQLLSNLRPFRELNILVLGETGVGKSTWINSFATYMRYATLEEAEGGELVTLIPSEFTVCDDNYEEFRVSTGADDNEVLETGQSSTQQAKVYAFPVGDLTLRVIDTPGIGDTRGIDQDKSNCQNILATLSHFGEIHGICILLKPNNAKLTVMFRFCIKELLTHLHRDACRNIVFCFTHSRGTSYRPGDTLPTLKKLLEDNKDVEISVSRNTVYCYDSEAYRFLAAGKSQQPVVFPEDERSNVLKSWSKSVEETKRMLSHFSSIPQHDTRSTLNLNSARTIIVNLPEPLAEISLSVQKMKAEIEEERKAIEAAEEDLEVLRKKQTVTRTAIEIEPRENPYMGCVGGLIVDTYTFF